MNNQNTNANTTGSSVSSFLTMPKAQSLLQELAMPEDNIHTWLKDLVLFNHIPFHNLVPDARMLPMESLRFFYIDPSWQNAMVDGALSIGNNTSLETQFTNVMSDVVKAASATVVAQISQQVAGLQPDYDGEPTALKLLSGMLFRSSIISSWPGLQIIPTFYDPAISTNPLRYEKIGSDLVLIIFAGVPTSICFRQPAHSLAFGVEDGDNNGYVLYLRGLGTTGFPAGQGITKGNVPVTVTFPSTGAGMFKAGGNNVLDIQSIVKNVQQGMITAGALAAGTPLTPSEFALQIVKTSEEATFTPPGTSTTSLKQAKPSVKKAKSKTSKK